MLNSIFWESTLLHRVDMLRKDHPDIYFEMSWHAETGWLCTLAHVVGGVRSTLISNQSADSKIAAGPVLDFLTKLEANEPGTTAGTN